MLYCRSYGYSLTTIIELLHNEPDSLHPGLSNIIEIMRMPVNSAIYFGAPTIYISVVPEIYTFSDLINYVEVYLKKIIGKYLVLSHSKIDHSM